MSDQTLTCRDCGQQFVFTAGEQAFYTERGFSPPMRCQSCRAKRKADRNSGGGGYDSASYGGNGGGGNVPEPASLTIMGAGLAALGAARRRRIKIRN